MIPIANDWQYQVRNAVKDSYHLLELLELPLTALRQPKFPCKVPLSFVGRMQKGNPKDPLLLQVLPSVSELINAPGFIPEPIQEKVYSPIPGLIHKYHGRALLTITGSCAVHCRYCFRQNVNYHAQNPYRHQKEIVKYIDDNNISEIILSGGDPLSLNNDKLRQWINALENSKSLLRLRVHSRLPVVIPQRIDKELASILKPGKLWCTVVLHVNHPNELNQETKRYFEVLSSNNIMLWNQSVLLKHVNDDAKTLAELSEKLIAQNIIPYYVHLLDKVTGSLDFQVGKELACSIESELRRILPGYLLPRFVIDDGSQSKSPIG